MQGTNIKQQLDDLTELAKAFKEYSRNRLGWSTETYRQFGENEIEVRCYFADNSDHTSVQFGGKFNGGISISFFSEPHYEFDKSAVGKLKTILENAKSLLETLKAEQASESEDDEKKRKEERKKVLLAELETL